MIFSFLNRSNLLTRGCFFVCCIILMISCKHNTGSTSEEPLARVGTVYLYPSDLKQMLPGAGEQTDSAAMARNYINNWIHETLLYQQADKNLSQEKNTFNKMVEDYRRSLITYQYESELIEQKLDTVVSDSDVIKYYEENKSNFELKDNIIKVIYVKVRQNAPKEEKVKEWYKSDNEKDKEDLANYCYQYADNFYLDENTWLFFDDLLKEIPIKLYDKEAFLQNNRRIETHDSIFNYYINIKGFMTRNSISPISFERKNIINIILNKRKVELIKRMREDIYNNAIKSNSFEIYQK